MRGVVIHIKIWGETSEQVLVPETALIPIWKGLFVVQIPATDVFPGMMIQGCYDETDVICIEHVSILDDSDYVDPTE